MSNYFWNRAEYINDIMRYSFFSRVELMDMSDEDLVATDEVYNIHATDYGYKG